MTDRRSWEVLGRLIRWNGPSSPIRRQLNYGTRVSRKVSTLLRKRRILSAPCRRGRHMLRIYRATGIRRPSSLRPGGRGLKAGMEVIPTARETMVAGWRWILAKSLFIFIFFLSSLPLGYCPYLSGTTISLLVRLTPFFLFWRGLMESRFNYNNFLAMWAFRVVSCLWLLVVHVSMLFLFFTTDIYTFIYFTLFLKGFIT